MRHDRWMTSTSAAPSSSSGWPWWVVYLIAILVMLAVAYGFVRVVLTTWERVSPSAPKGSSRPHAPVKSHAPVKRRDDFYGHHRGDRPASRAD